LDFIPKNKNNYFGNTNLSINIQNATRNYSLGSQNYYIDIKNTKEYLELQKLYIEEKNKNNRLSEQIQSLTNNYNLLYKELENAKRTINDLNTRLLNQNNQNNNIVQLQRLIDIKNQQINQLNMRINSISNNSNDRSGIIYMPGDKIIGIGFAGVNQQIQNYSRAYKDTEIVSRVEEELYNEYPEFKEKDTYLMLRANKIKRFKTLRENNIRNGDIIQVHIYDEEN
jgi:hypothetical protein